LGIVLSCLILLVNVDFGMSPDLVKGEATIVVQEVDESLVRVSSIFHDHEDVHPTRSNCPVFQSGEEDFDSMGLAVEGILWECFNSSSVEFGSFWHGIVNGAIIGKH